MEHNGRDKWNLHLTACRRSGGRGNHYYYLNNNSGKPQYYYLNNSREGEPPFYYLNNESPFDYLNNQMEVQFGKPLFRMDGNGEEWTSRAANGAKRHKQKKNAIHDI